MAEVTTVDGYQYIFDPKVVSIITDRDTSTGQAVTGIYGIAPAVVRIPETVDGFMTRVGIAARFAEFGRPNGSPIWISGTAVSALRAPLPDEYVAGVETVISVGKMSLGVVEDIAAVRDALNSHGAAL